MEIETIRYQKLAITIIESAVSDLGHPNAQIRAAAHTFFDDPKSHLSLWCQWLGLNINEVRRYKKSLDKAPASLVASGFTGGASHI
jgi:hypothetical protein